MKSLLITASLLLAGNVGARLGTTLEHRSLQGGDEPVDVLVRYKTGRGRSAIQANSKRIYSQFAKFNTVAASVPSYNLQALADDPDIVFIEEDYTLYKNGESTPFGIELTQGLSTVIPRNFESSACNDPNSFKIGIIDSGLSISHPDSPCGPSDNPSNCQGKVFGLEGFNWYDPIDEHGTHVAGTIGAIGGNNLGVRGMIQDAAVCYLIARVFGDDPSGTTKTSSVVAAVEWLEIQGAKVISMSLGGAFRSEALGEAIADAYANDVLVIASAGNDGETTLNYPASFAGVISVAAVDEDLQRAVFSQYNSGVDITAPGVGILSTVPLGSGSVGAVSFGNFAINGEYLRYSVEPKADGVSGILVECPDLGRNTCPGAGGHICLIKRGDINFEEKAVNCQAGGGIATIIYNHSPGLIAGRLDANTAAVIPVIGILQSDGEDLLKNYIGVSGKAEVIDGYSYLDGTSMSAPIVSGAASLIWRACGSCTNTQIEQCLEDTAADLGPVGWDEEYGHGLVQAESAYLCLIEDIGCCSAPVQRTVEDVSSSPTITASSPPSPSPSISTFPSIMPSGSPTMGPTGAPSSYPSASPSDSLFPSIMPSSGPTAPTAAPNTDNLRESLSTETTFLVSQQVDEPTAFPLQDSSTKQCTPNGSRCFTTVDCCENSWCYGLKSRRQCRERKW